MNVVLLRVGIDTGCGGIHSPLFADGTFEFLPIPDDRGLDERTYGNFIGRKSRPFSAYFPPRQQLAAASLSMHLDPEFTTFTYGDPASTKRGLARLKPGDLLVFYAGMRGWDCVRAPALYLAGFFEIDSAGFAGELEDESIERDFLRNFHVRHASLFKEQRERLVLIKGGPGSRLYHKAHQLGDTFRREDGSFWQMISPEMAEIFGRFSGIGSLQRSNPRWVTADKIDSAAAFIRSLL